MKFWRFVLYTMVLLNIVLTSCNSADDKIKTVESMIIRAEKNNANLTKSEIVNLEVKMKELQKFLDNNRQDFTDEQIKEIGNLQGRYVALLVKDGLNDFEESMNDLGNQIEGFIEGFNITNNNEN